jgi:hypothetical protein
MFASLSAEVRAPILMRELGVSNAFVAALCGIEETKLSKALRQLKELPNEDAKKLMVILPRLIDLRDSLDPLTLDLKNAANARRVLDCFDGQDVDTIRAKVSALIG